MIDRTNIKDKQMKMTMGNVTDTKMEKMEWNE